MSEDQQAKGEFGTAERRQAEIAQSRAERRAAEQHEMVRARTACINCGVPAARFEVGSESANSRLVGPFCSKCITAALLGGAEPSIITVAAQSSCTDELYTEFFTCSCGYDRVPRASERGVPELTARYCPGCGRSIEWRLAGSGRRIEGTVAQL